MTTAASPTGLPPFDSEAEEAVIATGMIEPRAIPEMMQAVSPGDFFREQNGWIWAAILDVWGRGEEPNQITVAYELSRRDRIEQAGGQTYLSDVIRRCPASNGEAPKFYAGLVKQCAVARQVIHRCHGLMELAYENSLNPGALVDRGMETFLSLGSVRQKAMTRSAAEILTGEKSPSGIGVIEEIEAFLAAPNEIRGLSTGWGQLDRMLNGLQSTRLYVVMGDTSAGKSVFVHFVLWNVARQGIPVFLVTTEMSGEEVMERLVYMHAGIDPESLRRRGPTTGQLHAIRTAEEALGKLPIHICDVGGIALPSLVSEARRQAASNGIGAMFVDHIQHIEVPGLTGVPRIEATMAGLKGIAMNTDLPLMAVSHINRVSAQGQLGLHSGKGGSAIEQDANVLLTLEPVIQDRGTWQAMSEEAADRQRTQGFLPIRVRSNKNRAGGKGWDVRHLNWTAGGRFTELARGEAG